MNAKGPTIDRRNFLKTSGLTAAAAAITACIGTHSAPAASAASAASDMDESNCILRKAAPEIVFDKEEPIAETTSGWVRGFIDNGIYTFRGIPYAEAGRFEEPHAPASWSGIKNCVAYGCACSQAPLVVKDNYILYQKMYWPMSENCQKLNIWSSDPSAKKPVMLWIHGGAYSTGYANGQYCTEGKSLCQKGDVVVVSINHRLNCLGFLDLSAYGEEYRYSGNLGLLDIIAALQWVRDNISRFGGDPDNVTVFGQSGGGGKILNLLEMPAAEGLFHKAIVESGRTVTMRPEEASLVTKQLFTELGIPEGETSALKAVDYEKLRIAGDSALKKVGTQLGCESIWCPVIDGDALQNDVLLANDFSARAGAVPMMIGTCFAEDTSNAYEMVNGLDYQKNEWDTATVDAKLTEKYGDKKDLIITEFRKAFPEKPLVDALYVQYLNYRGDSLKITQKRAKHSAPVYNYSFNYELPTMGGLLPYHCAELPFVFGNVAMSITTGATKQSYRLEDIMLGAWSAFAHTGTPNHKGMIDWPAYTNENGATMIFDTACRIGYHHDDGLLSALQD